MIGTTNTSAIIAAIPTNAPELNGLFATPTFAGLSGSSRTCLRARRQSSVPPRADVISPSARVSTSP